MAKFYLLFIGFILADILNAQIGINTENPQQLVHIDGKGNTSGNKNISDDVVIDKNGNMGIGTLHPSTKLHIVSDGTTPALRIVDGKQAKGKILGSEQDGTIGWFQPSSVIKKLSPTRGQTIGSARSILEGSRLEITERGDYLLIFSWYGQITGLGASNRTTNSVFYLWKNYGLTGQTLLDEIEYYITTAPSGTTGNTHFSLTIYFIAKDIKQGDTLSLSEEVGSSYGTGNIWSFDYSNDKSLMPSYTYIKISN